MDQKTKILALIIALGAVLVPGLVLIFLVGLTPAYASNEIPCSPPVENPYDPNTVIERCSDEDVIRDKETGEETGSTHGIPGGNVVCSPIDKEQFPGATGDEQCIQVGP